MFDIKNHRAKASAFATAIADMLAIKEPAVTIRKFETSHFSRPDGNILKLLARFDELNSSNVRLVRRDDTISLEVIDTTNDLIIHSSYADGGAKRSDEDTRKILAEHGHLSWSNATADKITSVIYQMMNSQHSGHDDIWMGRCIEMIRKVLVVLTELRDKGELALTESSFRDSLSLDTMIDLSRSHLVSEGSKKHLLKYLTDLPDFVLEEALRGEIRANTYTQHGYLSAMAITGLKNLLPAPVIHYDYQIKAPFKKVEAVIKPHGVEVSVFFHPRDDSHLLR